MNKIAILAIALLVADLAIAGDRDKEKAKFDLISSLEELINIDECRKSVKTNSSDLDDLPRPCNSLPTLSKFFFNKQPKLADVLKYLTNEEARVSEAALEVMDKYKIQSLGKMILSPKCVINNRPVNLDIYLNRLRGVPIAEEQSDATVLEAKFEENLKKKKHNNDDLIPMATPSEARIPARLPDATKPEPEKPIGEFEKEFAAFEN